MKPACAACGAADVPLQPLASSAFCPSCAEVVCRVAAHATAKGDSDDKIIKMIEVRWPARGMIT